MEKKDYIVILIALFLLALGSYFAFAIVTEDYNVISPTYYQNISATNSTLPIIFTYTNTTNVSASCILYLNTTKVFTNASVLSGVRTTMYSNITLGADGLKNFTISCTNGTTANSTVGYFYIDTTGPTLGSYTTVNVSGTASTSGNMVARYNFTTTDAYMITPTAYITIVSNGTAVNRTGTMTTNDTGLSIMHQIDLAPSDIPYDGYFVATPHGRDSLGNDVTGTNQTNFTKVSLYTGWNLIQVQENVTWMNVSQYSTEITKVSVWNTTSQGYDTYTVGSSTNQANAIKDGDAAYVYSKSNVGLLRKWSVDMGNSRNLSLSTGWNTLTAFNTSIQLYDICRQTIDNASATVKAVSFYDASIPTYYSQVCSIATGFNNNVTIPRGKAYWMNVNTTTTFMNRR